MEERQKAVSFLLALTMLTFNTIQVIYLSRDDMESMASVTVSYSILVLLFVRRLGCCEPWHDCRTSRGRSRRLEAAIWCLTLLLVLLLAYKLVRIAPPSAPVLLVAVAGATALGVGGCCAFLLHRRGWSKQEPKQLPASTLASCAGVVMTDGHVLALNNRINLE